MDIRELPIHDLVLDPNLNLRDRLDPDTVERYVEAWNRLPPVTVYEVDGKWLLCDGFHRHAAAVTLGRRTVPAEVIKGNYTEAMDFVAGANLHHGLPLSRAERRRAIELKLKLHHDRSDRHLAEDLCVGRELVAKIRRQLIEGGQIPAGSTRIGADGKVYPAVGRDLGERAPRGRAAQAEDQAPGRGIAPRGVAARDEGLAPTPTVVEEGPPARPRAPWEEEAADAKALAQAAPIATAAPSIDEMLTLMAKQIMDVVAWTQAEGFIEAYRSAGANSRGLFQTAAIKLAARADQLRKS